MMRTKGQDDNLQLEKIITYLYVYCLDLCLVWINLSVDEDNGAQQPPSSSLSIHVQHPQDLLFTCYI